VYFAAITLCVASQPVFVVYFVIDSVRKIFDIPSYSASLIRLKMHIAASVHGNPRA
jgi:hypothetical protein